VSYQPVPVPYYITQVLYPGEQVLWYGKPHPGGYLLGNNFVMAIGSSLLIATVYLFILVLTGSLVSICIAVPALTMLLTAVAMFWITYWRGKNTEYVVTSHRVITSRGPKAPLARYTDYTNIRYIWAFRSWIYSGIGSVYLVRKDVPWWRRGSFIRAGHMDVPGMHNLAAIMNPESVKAMIESRIPAI